MTPTRRHRVDLWLPSLRTRILVLGLGLTLLASEVTSEAEVLERRSAAVPVNSNNPVLGSTDLRTYERPFNIHMALDCSVQTPSPKYGEKKRCKDGANPDPDFKNTGLLKTQLMLAKWHHPHNNHLYKAVFQTQADCTSNCNTDLKFSCYYSTEAFDYLCGNKTAKELAAEKGKLMKIINLVRVNYRLLGDGRICYGPRLGYLWDPHKITKDDLALTAWYADAVKENMTKFFNRLEKGKCKSSTEDRDECILVKERGAFICGGRGENIRSICSLVILAAGVFLIQI